jgi:polygalacturonase
MATPYDFGAKGDGLTDDTNALGRWVQAGGGEIPAGAFRFNGPLRFGPGFLIKRWEGKLLYGEGWPSGYALCSRDWTAPTRGVRIDATAGGEIIYHGHSDRPRKGLGLTFLEDFEVRNPTVAGGAGDKGINLFSAEVRNSKRGRITGGRLSILSGQQGADGIHFTQNCSDIELVGLTTLAGDDGAGLTVEIPPHADSVIERITFSNCTLDNIGHSSLKVLLTGASRAAQIRDVTLRDCTMRTTLAPLGAGVPVIIVNRSRAAGGRIEHITISGGRSEVIVPEGGLQGGTALQIIAADYLHIRNHDMYYWSRTVLVAEDCKGLVIEGGVFESIRPIATNPAVPVFRTKACPDARIAPARAKGAWIGQRLVAKTVP